MITTFRGTWWFLSSFAEIPCPVPWFRAGTGDLIAPTREHGFQASKAGGWQQARWVLDAKTPGEAKRRGRQVSTWPGWDQRRREVMLELILSQFKNPSPRVMLAGTAGETLVEGNTWGDVYWGAVPVTSGIIYPGGNGPPPLWKPDEADPSTWLCGDNWLGRVLMMVRDVIVLGTRSVRTRYTQDMAHLRLEIDDGLKDEAQAYASRYGISLADAVRILLRKGIEAESREG